jgi:hypothetical protein
MKTYCFLVVFVATAPAGSPTNRAEAAGLFRNQLGGTKNAMIVTLGF